MTWVQLRSRRDPAVWVPLLVVLLIACGLAFAGQQWLDEWQRAFDARAEQDPESAIAEAVQLLRLCEVSLLVVSAGMGAFLFRFFQLGLREARIPPSGWWSLGAWRARVGPPAEWISRIGLFAALALPVSAIAIVWLLERLVRSLLQGQPAG